MTELLNHFALGRCIGFLTGIMGLWIVTGILSERQALQDADSRKINHIAVFVGGALLFGWMPEASARVNLYAVCLAIMALVAVVCRYRQVTPFRYAYAANTRQSDAPHVTFSFWFSWLVSIVALAIVDLLFAQMSVTRMAVLIVGIADGVAEPIGRRFGRHKYRVFSIWGDPSFRSLEGSLAVWGATLAVMLGCSTPSTLEQPSYLAAALLTAPIVAMVEATSPRGWDNFTLVLTAAGLTDAFLL
ncbi:MAG: hypothetical protein QNJ46_17240 [Leptolyngbyaceae cyanobacterium MO_188.B28]|nr:hypothetical protein [Leptolyngbyaceae cyanobacterium MO_188.B28]